MADESVPDTKVAADDPAQEESILKRRKKKKKDEKKEMTPSEELVSTLESQCCGYLSLWRAASLGDLKAVQRAIALNHYSAHTFDAAAASVNVPSSSGSSSSSTAAGSKRMSGVLSSNRRGSALSEDDFTAGLRAGQAAGAGGSAGAGAIGSGAGSLAPTSIDEAPAECGLTPLVAAVSGDHFHVVQYLLSVRADPSKACPALTGGATPLIAASKSADNVRCLEALLDAGAAVDAPDAAGNTPLMYAARSGNLRAAELLLSRGANPATGNKKGMSAAMFASLFARTAILELLHQRESDAPAGATAAGATAGAALLNAADSRGNTALHHAALCGHSKVAKALVRGLGAHATARNLNGKTAADVAVDKSTFNAIIGRE